MDEIFLHIGMHKTGSSSIQSSLYGYDHDGVRFARWGYPNHGFLITRAFDPDPTRVTLVPPMTTIRPEQAAAGSKAAFDRLESELKCEHVRKMIFSGEAIPFMSYERIQAFKQLLDKYAPKITVLAYIREPISFVSSMFQQSVRMGVTGVNMPLPDYRDKFEKFLSIFGDENVVFRLFSKDALIGGSAVADFCAQIGVSLDLVGETRANDSMPLEAVQLLSRFNEMKMFSIGEAQFQSARQHVIELLSQKFDTPFQIDEAEVRAHLDWADVRWMEEVAGFGLAQQKAIEETPSGPDLATQIANIPDGVIKQLRSELDRLNIRHDPLDDAAMLMSRLFLYFVISAFPDQKMADTARDLALKLEAHPDFSLTEARDLMGIAHRIRPRGDFIRRKLEDYNVKINGKR